MRHDFSRTRPGFYFFKFSMTVAVGTLLRLFHLAKKIGYNFFEVRSAQPYFSRSNGYRRTDLTSNITEQFVCLFVALVSPSLLPGPSDNS